MSVLSLKGGVGKTTVVLGLASAALRRGVRTLVIDLDPQCNATSTLEPEESKASIYDVLRNPSEENVEQAIRPSRWGDGHRRAVRAPRTPSCSTTPIRTSRGCTG